MVRVEKGILGISFTRFLKKGEKRSRSVLHGEFRGSFCSSAVY